MLIVDAGVHVDVNADDVLTKFGKKMNLGK